MKVYRLTLSRWTNHAKEWCALLTGLDDKYGFKREFVPVFERRWSRSGKGGHTDYELTHPGFYQVSDPQVGEYGRQAQKFFKLTPDFQWIPVSREEIEQAFGLRKEIVNG